MSMFYTPSPRQFHYSPRFYDPEKEKWEALKKKYADENGIKPDKAETNSDEPISAENQSVTNNIDDDLAYFERKVRSLDREEKKKSSKLTWRDMFKKREMPTFNYQPRFSGENNNSAPDTATTHTRSNIKIQRRFDMADNDYLKPVSGGKIILYTLLACMLLYWILF